MKKVLITGVAGFIGFHLAKKFCNDYEVHGLDIINTNDNSICAQRLNELQSFIRYHNTDIKNFESVSKTIQEIKPDFVLHLAACTGIANSALQPELYYETNVKGFQNILDTAAKAGIKHIFYASSSSVYNEIESKIFKEENVAAEQLSVYGKTKRMNEVMAEQYTKDFDLTCVGMRFFTVYGSWVRDDMAAWKFMNALYEKKPVVLYNNGDVFRDFTHVSTIVESISLLVKNYLNDKITKHEIYNIGNGAPVSVKQYLETIAENLNIVPEIIYKPLPSDELPFTHADTSKLFEKIQYEPTLSLKEGVKEMTDWFMQHKKIKEQWLQKF